MLVLFQENAVDTEYFCGSRTAIILRIGRTRDGVRDEVNIIARDDIVVTTFL